ncbi:MAG: DUF1653 domain-containing protein, partial [Sphingomonadales bacterium]
ETLDPLVVYKPLYETPDVPPGTLWVRPAAMFLEMVETNDGTVLRFTRLPA